MNVFFHLFPLVVTTKFFAIAGTLFKVYIPTNVFGVSCILNLGLTENKVKSK